VRFLVEKRPAGNHAAVVEGRVERHLLHVDDLPKRAMAHPLLSAFRDLEIDPRDETRARAFGAALDALAPRGIEALEGGGGEAIRSLLREFVRSARARWDDALVVRVLDEWLPREESVEVRVRLLVDRALVTASASTDESRVVEAWQAALVMARKAGDAPGVARAESALAERKERKAQWSKRAEAFRAAANASEGVDRARALACAAEEALRFGKSSGRKKSQGLVEANAEAELERAFDLDPAAEPAARLLANVLDARRRLDERTRVMKRHAAAAPADAAGEASTRVAYALCRERKFDEALACFEACDAVASSDLLVLDRLATCAIAVDDLDATTASLEALATKAQSHPQLVVDALAGLVHVLGVRRGRRDLAQPFGARLREFAPDHEALRILDAAPQGDVTTPLASVPGDEDGAQEAVDAHEGGEAPAAAPLPDSSVASAPAVALTPKDLEVLRVRLRRDPADDEARLLLKGHYRLSGPAAALVELLRYELAQAKSAVERRAALAELGAVHRTLARNDAALIGTLSQLVALEPVDREAARELSELLEKHGRWRDALVVLGKLAESEVDPARKLAASRALARRWSAQMAQAPQVAEAWEKVLALEPSDAEAFAALRDILAKRHAHSPLAALLESRAGHAATGAEREGLLLEAAKLFAERLGRAEDAIAHLRRILAANPAHLGAIEALERIADARRDYALLSEVLEARLSLTQDESLQLTALQRLAALYAERLQDPVRALATWRRVLQISPSHSRAARAVRDALIAAGDIDELERTYAASGDLDGFVSTLVAASEREGDPARRYELLERAARVLAAQHPSGEPVVRIYEKLLALDPKRLEPAMRLVSMHEAEKRYGRLGGLYELLLAEETTPEARDAWMGKLVELYVDRVPDAARAWRFAVERFEASPVDATSIERLEAVAKRTGRWGEIAAVFGASRERSPAMDATLRAKIATIQAHELGAVDDAVATLESLWADGHDVFRDLERLLRAKGRTDALRDAYARRVAQLDDDGALALSSELALLEEEVFGDVERASAAHRSILVRDPAHVPSLRALVRFAEAAADTDAAESLLARLVDAVAEGDRAPLRLRRARLLAAGPSRFDVAWTELRTALDEGLDASEAAPVLERLTESAEVRADVLARLAEVYVAVGRPADAASALERLTASIDDPARRGDVVARRAALAFEALGDRVLAVRLACELVSEDPTRTSDWASLRRYDDDATRASGAYIRAARAALEASPVRMASSLRAELAEHVAEALDASEESSAAFDHWLVVLESVASHERARERGLAACMREGAGAERVDRFFRAAYGEAAGERTLANWASALRIQGAYAAAADRLAARLEVVGATDEAYAELADCLEAAGLFERFADVLAAHAAASPDVELRARQTHRRIVTLADRLGDRSRARAELVVALESFCGDPAFESAGARLLDDAAGARGSLLARLAASAERGGRIGPMTEWLEALAAEEADPDVRQAALRRCLATDVVRADDERFARVAMAVCVLAPGDVELREAWIDALRRLGRSAEFVDAMVAAFARDPSPETRAGVLRAADLASSVLDDAAAACALFARVRDDAGAAHATRVDASKRGLVVARLALPREALLAALDAHHGLELSLDESLTTLEEAARVCDVLGLEGSLRFERWASIVEIAPDHLAARENVADLAESLGRFDRAVTELEAIAARSGETGARIETLLRGARLAFERLDAPARCLDALDATGDEGSARRDVQELRLAAARRLGRSEIVVAALRSLVMLEDDAPRRAPLRSELASLLAQDSESEHEAIDVAEASLDDDPSHTRGAEVLRGLLDHDATRARAAEVLIARFGRDGAAPALLVAALVARASSSGDDDAASHLLHAARVAEDVLCVGPQAFERARSALARVTPSSARRVGDELVRLARALGLGRELVEALDARVASGDDDVKGVLLTLALASGPHIGAGPVTMLGWLDASIAIGGATPELLEARLVEARASGEAARVLEALGRVEALRAGVEERFGLELERMTALDALGDREDEALEAGFRALLLDLRMPLVESMRRRLDDARRVDDALRLEEIVRDSSTVPTNVRAASLVRSFDVALRAAGDPSRACAFLDEAIGLAPDTAGLVQGARDMLRTPSLPPELALAAARSLERAGRACDDRDAVVEALEALRAGDAEDASLLETLAEARLARGDAPSSVAALWVDLLCKAPGHRRAFGALSSLEEQEARLNAGLALATWLETQSFDDEETAGLCEFVADELVAAGRRERALPFLLRAYRANPSARSGRFELLDELLAECGESSTRVELHRERAMEALDVAVRFERLLTVADLEEQRDGDARAARTTYEEALEVGDFDLAAVAALERVYAAEEDWRALADLLTRRIERTPAADERARVRARLASVALERLGSADEALDVVVAWLEDSEQDTRAREECRGWVERLVEVEAVRGRVVVECEPHLRTADGRARARVLEVAADLEPTRVDAGRWWLSRARYGVESGDDIASAVVALSRSFSGDPTSSEVRAVARALAERGADWADIARACEATLGLLEAWERRDAVLGLVAMLDEDAGDARAALRLLDSATTEPDADDALHVKSDELSMIVADWRSNVRALRRRASATLDGAVRIDCLRRASAVAEEELEDVRLALDIAHELLSESDDHADLSRAARLARAVDDRGALRTLLPRLLDARSWSGDEAEIEAIELVDVMTASEAGPDDVLDTITRALDAGLPRPRLVERLLAVLRATGRDDELVRALESEAERSVVPVVAAAAWDERSLVCERKLDDRDAAFEAARRACEASSSAARFERLVAVARPEPRLLEEALAFVEGAEGPGREEAEWAILEASLAAFVGDARLGVAKRLGAAAWAADRPAVAADAWLVALSLDPADDPFLEAFDERLERFGDSFLPRYVDVLGGVERDALDPLVAASAALRRGELFVERLARPADALPSLRRAEEFDVDPSRVATLLVRALEAGGPSRALAESLDRAASFASGDDLAALALRSARAWVQVGAEPSLVLDRVLSAIDASAGSAAEAEDLLERALEDAACFPRASERLEAVYRARGDRLARIALKRRAVAFAEEPGDRLACLVELARTISDLEGPPEEALEALVDAASVDPFDDEVYVAFVDVLSRRPAVGGVVPRVLDRLRGYDGAGPSWVRFSLAMSERAELATGARIELLRAAVAADPENLEGIIALEASLSAEVPGAELVRTLLHRGRLELDPDARSRCLRRALALATETLSDARLAESVLVAWAELDEGPELFAHRVAEADRVGDPAGALAWSRRAAEESFEPEAQARLWTAHLDRAERLRAWPEALTALERLLATDPTDVALQRRQRIALREAGEFAALARAYEDHAMVVDQDDARVALALELAVLCEHELEDPGRAREAIRSAAETGARADEALAAAKALAERCAAGAWLAEVYEVASDAASARGESDRAASYLVAAAGLLEGPIGDAEAALERLERARALSPEDAAIASTIVRVARQVGRWELAIDVLEDRFTRDPSRGSFADLVATADASREGWLLDRALDVWRRLAFDAPDLEDALYAALLREDRLDDAHAFLRERTERMRGAGAAREAVSLVRGALAAAGDPRPIALLELAVQVDPDDTEATFELAVRYAEDARAEDARAVLEGALPTLDRPERAAHAHLLLGRLARDQWDGERARRHFSKAHDAAPAWPIALRELAAAAQEAGDSDDAFTHWKALLLLPLDETGEVRRSDALTGLARLYEDGGDRAKAAELYAHALAVAPDHEEAARGAARSR
jgi:hypothetical protein